MDRKLEPLDQQLANRLLPYGDLIRRLCTIPGVDFTTAAVIIAEIGLDMSRFPDAAQLVSRAGLCPGNNESAGKRFSGGMRKGNRYLRRVLTQSGWSITQKKECFLTSLFWRVAARGGRTKAAMAVAHRILSIAWKTSKKKAKHTGNSAAAVRIIYVRNAAPGGARAPPGATRL